LRLVNAVVMAFLYRRRMPCFRFHGELNDLLPTALRSRAFDRDCAENATVKHAIEALGVPHTEVGIVLVDGHRAGLDSRVGERNSIDVHPMEATGSDRSGAGPLPSFIADAHLGGLARRLRLLGFDTLLADDAPDRLIAERAGSDGRILLSRDRELLKHRGVSRGRYVRAQRTDDQLREVVRHFGLRPRLHPFSRCLECNGLLHPAAKAEVAFRLPPRIAATQSEFTLCTGCGRVYWRGSHWQRLKAIVEAVRAEAPQ